MTTTSWMPDGHKKDWVPPEPLPGSLREAISAFVLACAARRARGQVNEHNSMLVHVTRFQDVQNRVARTGRRGAPAADATASATATATPSARGGRAARLVGAGLRSHERVVPGRPGHPGQLGRGLGAGPARRREDPGPDRQRHLPRRAAVLRAPARRAIRHRGRREQAVPRADPRRAQRQLLPARVQGLRHAAADGPLVRLPAGLRGPVPPVHHPALCEAYVEITAANDELRREFEEMAALDAKPEEFGLRVRASPAGLAITAANKMRRGLKVKLSYSGDIPETVIFDLRDARRPRELRRYWRGSSAGSTPPTLGARDSGSRVWTGVPAEEIVDGFLAEYVGRRQGPPGQARVHHRVHPPLPAGR